jgi:hypothetical protein
MVPAVLEGPAQLFEVDALAAAVGIAAVGEEQDAKWPVHVHPIIGYPESCTRVINVAIRRFLNPY